MSYYTIVYVRTIFTNIDNMKQNDKNTETPLKVNAVKHASLVCWMHLQIDCLTSSPLSPHLAPPVAPVPQHQHHHHLTMSSCASYSTSNSVNAAAGAGPFVSDYCGSDHHHHRALSPTGGASDAYLVYKDSSSNSWSKFQSLWHLGRAASYIRLSGFMVWLLMCFQFWITSLPSQEFGTPSVRDWFLTFKTRYIHSAFTVVPLAMHAAANAPPPWFSPRVGLAIYRYINHSLTLTYFVTYLLSCTPD